MFYHDAQDRARFRQKDDVTATAHRSAPHPVSDASVERAFTWDRVRRLTGLTKRQLQYWDEEGFIRPSLSYSSGRGHPRLYDFRDLVALRVAAELRRKGISLQLIRKVDRHLRKLDYTRPLSQVRFWAAGNELFFQESASVRAGRSPEQIIFAFTVPIQAIVEKLESEIAALNRRPVGQFERRRGTLGSKEVFVGTRIPVDSIRRMLAAGLTDAEIRAAYPDLRRGDVAAVRKESQSRPGRNAAAS